MEDNDDFSLRNILSTDSRLDTEWHQGHKNDQKWSSLPLMTLQIIVVLYDKFGTRDVHRMRAAWPNKEGLQVDLTVMHHEINQELGMHYVFPAFLWTHVACFYYRNFTHLIFFFFWPRLLFPQISFGITPFLYPTSTFKCYFIRVGLPLTIPYRRLPSTHLVSIPYMALIFIIFNTTDILYVCLFACFYQSTLHTHTHTAVKIRKMGT